MSTATAVSRPPSSFDRQKIMKRRSLMKKPSFLVIDDEADGDEHGDDDDLHHVAAREGVDGARRHGVDEEVDDAALARGLGVLAHVAPGEVRDVEARAGQPAGRVLPARTRADHHDVDGLDGLLGRHAVLLARGWVAGRADLGQRTFELATRSIAAASTSCPFSDRRSSATRPRRGGVRSM